MDRNEIISSGLLEAYITGDLTDQQRNEVEELLSTDSEMQGEYIKIQKTLEHLALNQKVSAPSDIKTKLFSESLSGEKEDKTQVRRIDVWKYVAAACVIFTLISSAIAYNFWQKWKETSSELLSLRESNQQMAEDYNQVSGDLQNIREDLSVLISPSFKRIILSGTENAPTANAVVYWDPEKEEVLLNSASLGTLDEEQQYQLWALVDGTPINAGVFDPKTGEFQNMNNIASADAFAVTVEPKGGSESPTLSTMQVFGKTS